MEIERARRVINWRVAALEQSRVAVFGNLYVRTQCAATNVPAHPHARSRYALPRGRHCQHGVRRATPACSHRAVKTGCAHGGADERTTLSAPSSPRAPHPTDTRSSSPRARTPSIRPCTASFRRRAARFHAGEPHRQFRRPRRGGASRVSGAHARAADRASKDEPPAKSPTPPEASATRRILVRQVKAAAIARA
jgi:hypothetical protein